MSDTQTQNTPVNMSDKVNGLDEQPAVVEVAEQVAGLDNNTDETFTLTFKGSKPTVLSRKLMSVSKLVNISLEESAKNGEALVLDINSDTVSETSFDLFLEYLRLVEQHNGCKDVTKPPPPLKSTNLLDFVSDELHKEVIEYVLSIREKHGKQAYYDYILAINYLDCNGLLHLLCAGTASWIKGNSLEKIKEVLDPTNDSV